MHPPTPHGKSKTLQQKNPEPVLADVCRVLACRKRLSAITPHHRN
jgi:hypothetical protein